MSANYKLLSIVTVAISIVVLAISINKIDPFYKTATIKHATLKNLIYSTGKFGATLQVVVISEDGEVFYFAKATSYSKKIGDNVNLHLYKRKITGAEKYVLE